MICPKGHARDVEEFSDLDGVQIHRIDVGVSTSSVGYLQEYGLALLRMSVLVRRLSRTKHFDVQLGRATKKQRETLVSLLRCEP